VLHGTRRHLVSLTTFRRAYSLWSAGQCMVGAFPLAVKFGLAPALSDSYRRINFDSALLYSLLASCRPTSPSLSWNRVIRALKIEMRRTHDGTVDVRLRHSSVKAFLVGSERHAGSRTKRAHLAQISATIPCTPVPSTKPRSSTDLLHGHSPNEPGRRDAGKWQRWRRGKANVDSMIMIATTPHTHDGFDPCDFA
jgi:hypothetical protein